MTTNGEDTALHLLLEGTASHTGAGFHRALVENLAKALGTYGAWVTEYVPEKRSLRALAFYMGGQWIDDWEEEVTGTPCEAVIREERLVHVADRIVELFPQDSGLREMAAVSYLGVPLKDLDGRILGHLAVLDKRPMPEEPRTLALFRIFAARAAAELMRARREAELRDRQARTQQLIDGAMDAILELDEGCAIRRMNAAAKRVFGCRSRDLRGEHVESLLTPESSAVFEGLLDEARSPDAEEGAAWLPAGFEGRTQAGATFPIEGTLSTNSIDGARFHTLILRNSDERLEAERKIEALRSETRYLQEELDSARGFGEILGESESLAAALRDVAQVAETDASVLILGETGTGKELIARAIHERSLRREGPLVRLNCGAVPQELVESELFGHERGAFTGATQQRTGRFELADGGTMFLDEVGELSPEMQVKLLRVLQEGEFEPVGSSKTRRVDVRVISATNRDLKAMVEEGSFREDLYYRLEVFPLHLPPLRERGDDVVLLAAAFAESYARRAGKTLAPLSEDCKRRLRAYAWPGNVRELQNVIERAVITSRESRLNLDRALPAEGGVLPSDSPAASALASASHGAPERVLTAEELVELERENVRRALEQTGWRVAGESGAASLLGLKPTTLKSRMKALGLQRSGD